MPDPLLCPLDHDEPAQAWSGVLCKTHRRQFIRDIRCLPALYDDLELQLHPAGPAMKPFTTGQGETPTFVNGRIADCRDRIWASLSALARVVVEDRKVDPPADSTPHVVAAFLDRHADWICRQPFADDEAVNFRDLEAEAYSLAYPHPVRRIVCARCVEVVACDVETHTERRCGGDLVAVLRLDEQEQGLDPSAISCTVCGTQVARRYWLKLGERINEVREAS